MWSENATTCSSAWGGFWEPYNSIDNYARLTVCVIGCITNILNIVILTRKNMRNPVNTIFTALAVTDFLCVLRKGVDRSRYFYRLNYGVKRTSWARTVDDLVNEVLFTIFHTWSIYLTLLVALWRYVGVLHPLKSRLWCTTKNARWGIAAAIGFSTLLVAPMFIGMGVVGRPAVTKSGKNVTRYGREQSPLGEEFYLWIHGLLIKLLPCFVLTFFSLALIWTLVQARRAKKKLHETGPSNHKSIQNSSSHANSNVSVSVKQMQIQDGKKPHLSSREKKQQEDFDRTTRMILVILIIFLLTEMPYGIYSILDVLFDSYHFGTTCVEPIKGFFQLNEYISSSTSFFIYVYMSGRFRKELIQIWRQVTRGQKQKQAERDSSRTTITSTTTTTSSSTHNL